MHTFANKQVLVIGLGRSGVAAASLLRRVGASVTVVDRADDRALQNEAAKLRSIRVNVLLGTDCLPCQPFDLAIVSPGVPMTSSLGRQIEERGIPVIGEIELAYQHSLCLHVAITGTNGKTTTTELVARLMQHAHRKTIAAGNIGLPFCEIVPRTKDLDFVTLEVSSFQLETILYFRPTVAVLLNITPDHLDRYATMADYARAKARIFMNQQVFDWAIVQSEALSLMRSLDLKIPSKVITFSATDRTADLFFDRGLLLSRIPGWEGPLFDMDKGKLRGPHNAENLMAALAVGRVLRVPLEDMVEALKSYDPAPHRCQLVAERQGIQFVNDSKATNPDALRQAILAMRTSRSREPNLLLIAGGKDKGLGFHDLGPLLTQRVKHAFLIGETREKLRAAWGLFVPCSLADSLSEAVTAAAKRAVSGDVVLLSPGNSSFDQFENYQHRGKFFCEAVQHWLDISAPLVKDDTGYGEDDCIDISEPVNS